MKRFRTILIPLLLCCLILTAGFGLPALFGRAVPDFKDAPESVAIAGKESPLYLEDDTEIALPPWDAIAADSSVPLSEYPAMQIDADFANGSIQALAGLFGAVPAEAEDFVGALRVFDDTFLFLHGYTYTAVDGEAYTLDLVLDISGIFPLSLHVRPLSDEPLPASDADQLLTALETALQFWQTQLYERPEIYNADSDARMQWLRDTLSLVYHTYGESTYAHLVSQFCTFLMACEDIQPGGSAWTAPIFAPGYLEVGYTISYENETVIVLTDYSNMPYTLYYDGDAQKITGFGLDARLAGYTGYDSERDAP